MADVAQLAGVSLSTVDRVLNERGSVSDRKRRKVLEAARELGLRRVLPSPVHGLLRFDLLMVDSPTDHFQRLTEAFSRQADLLRSRLVLQRQLWAEAHPEQLLELIRNPRTPRQGLIVVGQDTPTIREALAAQLALGVPVILLTSSLSDLPGATYVGIDNQRAGRSAGRLLSQWLRGEAGRVLLITNSLLYHAHQQRVGGFLDVLRERAPQLEVIGPVECQDDNVRTAAVLRAALQEGSLLGLYTTGSGSTGVCQALLEQSVRPVWIGHEATEQHHRLLRDGLLSLVIDQDPAGQAEAAVQHLLYANGDLDTPPQVQAQLRLVIDETLPE
ncbi:LacI family DNA-binding transcriptional regulator [Pseudomonas vanderleydeniana]|uniref:LacI family DNA-binding transcriptional regulator n=1 Tax=Pseudomonas vanderleydeniana TaxID=2745495 RepID=A0A9E6PRK0_9PSED|nr:LacI family DNA-binding transcriptional regulator [Pseudomonas vanderleydeniana]QXI30893.1 LacI family DNA-binding transcriptional regulator [Pseudomonas vanderleydeniana]